MKYLVLFSMLLIVASVTILMMPQTEGFTTSAPASITDDDDHDNMYRNLKHPAPAGHRNTSSTAGAADGTSDHQYLLDGLLAKHDRLFEAFENKVNPMVSATTTQKKSIASTSSEAFTGMSGSKCNPQCVSINNTSDAIGGNCVNPKLPDNNPDYSKKYCPAFRPPDGDPLMRDQECMTCGYYKYAANCIKHADPKNPKKCTLYGSYEYEHPTGSNNFMKCNDNDPICNLFHGVENSAGNDGETTPNTGPTCSAANCTPKEVNVKGSKCIIPGCISADNGMLPYPMGFYGNDMINPCIGKGANGFMCPAITSGTMYDSAGGSNDPCYTTNGTIDKTKFQSMNQVPICNRVKPISQQNFSAQGQPGAQSQGQPGAQGQGQPGAQGQGQPGAQGHDRRSKKRGSVYNNSGSSTYVDPVPGTLYLGIF